MKILEGYEVSRKKIKEYRTFTLYQVIGEKNGELKPLYKTCELRKEAKI